MKLATIGDMAQAMQLRRDTSSVKSDLNRLTRELNSGLKADLQTALRGQFGPLAGLERSLDLNGALKASNGAAARFAEGQQIALENLQAQLSDAGPGFLKTASTGEAIQLGVTFANAGRQLEQVISALNGRSGDQALFSGAATDRRALADSETILAALGAALAPFSSPADVEAAADAWFNAPSGGFETVAYLGSTTPLGKMDIAQGQGEAFEATALDPAIRDTIKGLAVAALMDRGLLAGDGTGQRAVLKGMGEALVGASDRLTALRADIGFAQERIEAARVRSEAEEIGLQQARAALVEADPYETATRLNEVQARLETIYTVTARISRLSLAAVLR